MRLEPIGLKIVMGTDVLVFTLYAGVAAVIKLLLIVTTFVPGLCGLVPKVTWTFPLGVNPVPQIVIL